MDICLSRYPTQDKVWLECLVDCRFNSKEVPVTNIRYFVCGLNKTGHNSDLSGFGAIWFFGGFDLFSVLLVWGSICLVLSSNPFGYFRIQNVGFAFFNLVILGFLFGV